MVDSATLEEIVRLKYALRRRSDDSDSDASSIGTAVTNRGNKLKRKASDVYEGKLSRSLYQREPVQYANRQRIIIHRHHPERPEYDSEEDEEEEDIYADVHIEHILAPLSHPSELPYHSAYAVTFSRKTLEGLARQVLALITSEHRHLVALTSLLTRLLGDDTAYLLSKVPTLAPANSNALRAEALGDAPVSGQAEEEPAKRVTRLTSYAATAGLVPPSLNSDSDMGLSSQEVFETKRMLQAAIERSQEYIRGLERVRNGLFKAKRLKSMVLEWCKEASGDQQDENDESVE